MQSLLFFIIIFGQFSVYKRLVRSLSLSFSLTMRRLRLCMCRNVNSALSIPLCTFVCILSWCDFFRCFFYTLLKRIYTYSSKSHTQGGVGNLQINLMHAKNGSNGDSNQNNITTTISEGCKLNAIMYL